MATVRLVPVEFLSDEQAEAYGTFSEEPTRPELERFFFLDDVDRDLIALRRTEHHRLGFVLQRAVGGGGGGRAARRRADRGGHGGLAGARGREFGRGRDAGRAGEPVRDGAAVPVAAG
ncbi:DUF4158 domain-containing protein [Streptomyces kasugaensis]|uniref:DUF4158 domain-containing protein n=1 Tax=Streptomyces kasugaensis TaxID=1946 RepID=A0A4V6MU08_STRKA|nr:DUF4158 domain-containing protein [Streptomyces kasugaensis]